MLPKSFTKKPPMDKVLFRKLLLSYPGKAIHFLHQRYFDQLLKYSMSFTQDENASEDIVQETFIHVWEAHKKIAAQDYQSMLPYLLRVVKNKSLTSFNETTKKNDKRVEYTYSLHQPFEHSHESEMIASEKYEEIIYVISSMPEKEKECLMMSLSGEMTNRQIAEHLNVTVKAVERSITSARKRLKKYWDPAR